VEHASGQPSLPIERSGTVIETEEEIREAIRAGLKGQQQAVAGDRPPAPSAPPAQPAAPIGQPAPTTQDAAVPPARPVSPYRPTSRPPIALLTVCDDGRTDGEIIRIRDQKFTIGRTEGDLRIPIDGRISARHVEITLQATGGIHRWVVTDLQSTHGMFVRVSRTVLNDRAEFLVGNARYRFESSQPLAEQTTGAIADIGSFDHTKGWADGPSPLRVPALTELLGNEIGNRTLLVKPEYWIGTDPTCSICRPDDPFCEPRHARLFRGQNGGWHAEHNKTQNGLWIRMPQIVVDSLVRFQIGEQRFQIKVV
jgi:pSer/pThr/pTyr-binding forkhead associated (FHA) protein